MKAALVNKTDFNVTVLDTCVSQWYTHLLIVFVYMCFILMSLTVFQKNGTDDGDYIFFTGKQNYQDFARIDEWNGQR